VKELYNDIIYRDIVARLKLSSDRQIREMAYYLASNFTHRFTYLSVAKATGIKSSETVQDYIRYLEEAYLVGVLTKYDYKVGEQLKSPKKIYFIDNGLVGQIGFTFSGNMGPRLENAVYVELRRREQEAFYYHDKQECDFVVRENAHITKAYQVTTSLADADTRQREINGLVAAMDAFDLKEGVIITLDETEELTLDKGRKIYVIPFYRWVFEEKL
jgi:predicted AAA+ superfamily ATPase